MPSFFVTSKKNSKYNYYKGKEVEYESHIFRWRFKTKICK